MKKQFEEAKKEYMSTSAAVSDQLDQMLEDTMAQSGLDPYKETIPPSMWLPYWRTFKTVMYFIIVGIVLLNISEGFAEKISNIPLIGPIADWLTFREYGE